MKRAINSIEIPPMPTLRITKRRYGSELERF